MNTADDQFHSDVSDSCDVSTLQYRCQYGNIVINWKKNRFDKLLHSQTYVFNCKVNLTATGNGSYVNEDKSRRSFKASFYYMIYKHTGIALA